MNHEEKAAVTLRLPSTLSSYSGGRSQIALRANTVEQLLSELSLLHPLLWQHLCNEQGHVREYVRLFVNNEVIGGIDGLQTPLKTGQEIIVIPMNV